MKITLPSCSARHIGALCLATLLPLTSAHAALPGLTQTPLYLSTSVEPNIFFLHDDSNSMDSEVLIIGDFSNAGQLNDETREDYRFYEQNPLYYNPNKIYRPWPGPNHNDGGRDFSDMSITAARVELGMTGSATDLETRDLTQHSFSPGELATWCKSKDISLTTCHGWRYYYRDANSNKQLQWVANMDAAGQTNFANWYTYHRSRKNMAKNAIGLAVKAAPGKRLGFGGINDIANEGEWTRQASDVAFIKDNNSANVYEKLYNTMGNGLTPLRAALAWVGKYYETGAAVGGANTTVQPSPILSLADGGACQLNHTILITDGYYNDAVPTIGNVDGDKGPPYADDHPNTLADVAMYYYSRDLKPALPDKANGTDTATHQRMNTHTISLGLKGTPALDPATVDLTSAVAWPLPGDVDIASKIDDLFHAAVNGRGSYTLASNPNTLIDALNKIVAGTQSPSDSSNAVTTSAFRLAADDLAISSSFDPSKWSGTLKAFKVVDANGNLNTTSAWSSDDTLKFNDASRVIITSNGSAGVPFLWDNLTTTQRSNLGFTDDTLVATDVNAYAKVRLNYLRGKTVTDPDTNDSITFRSRSVPLGDIVNSSPVHVGIPALRYPDAAPFGETGKRYGKFWNDNKSRTPVVYVGANDGMLHGFDANTGKELLAYVPNAIFGNLKYITDPSFVANHKYFVDQTPTVSDVYINGEWRTVLVSGLGGGGRGLFALNITNPGDFAESKAASIAMWEFTNANDADLGYTVAKPVIALAENGKWVAISGNGYGSDSGLAALFILDLDTKVNWIEGDNGNYKKITDTNLTNTDNGLFSPAAVDSDGNGKVDRVYAGDLLGNLWVFDLKTNTSRILFTAKDKNGKAQPITSKPSVTVHPTQATTGSNRPNMLVMFGTGSYLTSGDLSNSDDQSFYAVWDDGSKNLKRDDLAAQSFDQGVDDKL
ncbi:MAG: PilC/PilY family type IV pilus protein, partial [Pseudomonadota bacterium]|nr:PilC/PilY family type IV pilus protein [Pseudomonadota bacterium]